jgi:hypothetical protein
MVDGLLGLGADPFGKETIFNFFTKLKQVGIKIGRNEYNPHSSTYFTYHLFQFFLQIEIY